MKISSKDITIKYQIAKEFCSCCSRAFDIPELGEMREFDINLRDLFNWADWTNADDVHDEDIEDVVSEYIFDTIHFYALNSNERLKIGDGEVAKVTNMVLEEINTFN